MSIFTREWEARGSGMRQPDRWTFPASPVLECTERRVPAYQDIHEIRLVLGIRFAANSAQYARAKRNAQKALLHRLYGDTLGKLHEAMHAIGHGDRERALQLLAAIETDLLE